MHVTLNDWIRQEAIPFSADSLGDFNAAVDSVIASLGEQSGGDSVELLGFGEALHGGEDILILRNRLFQRLVTAHGYGAIAIESSFPAARFVNEYITDGKFAAYDDVKDRGFGHGFGQLEANRELVEWMRHYNADSSHKLKLRFYGFDIPDAATGYASPRAVLHFAVDYLSSMDSASTQAHRQRIDSLLGQDSEWENPAVYADPKKAVGLSPAAAALRIATEDLITEFRIRRPALIAKRGQDQYRQALQHALVARELLNSYAALAGNGGYAIPLGIRDALIADNLAYIVAREHKRGKALAFAHNGHLQRGKCVWPVLGKWWPAGSHLNDMLGSRYAVIGTAVGVSDANGIGPAETGSLEAVLTALPGPTRFIPTHKGEGLPAAEIAAIPTRSGSMKNPTYGPLTAQSMTDFDWLAVLDSTTYTRGGRPLPA